MIEVHRYKPTPLYIHLIFTFLLAKAEFTNVTLYRKQLCLTEKINKMFLIFQPSTRARRILALIPKVGAGSDVETDESSED